MDGATSLSDPCVVGIEALGVPIDIVVSGRRIAEAAPVIARVWSGAIRAEGDATRVLRIGTDDEDASVDLGSDEDDHLLHHLSQLVTQVAIEARAGELMMFHAAGLADPETGRTVALVAPSGTGKTTLCRSFGPDFGYISDETVGFDVDLTVLPYRKPLSIVRAGAGLKSQVSPDQIQLLAAPEKPTLAAIVLIERDESVADLEISEVRTVAALPLLAEHTSYLTRHERPLGFIADALEATGGLRVVRYRDVDDLRPLVAELTGGAS